MRHVRIAWVAFTVSVIAAACVSAAEGPVPDLLPTVGSIERLDPRFDVLVPQDAVIEVLATGFVWAEGPVWLEREQALLFSDIPRNRVMRWHATEGLSVFLEPSGYTGPSAYGNERGSNGLTLDRQGNLISCEHGDRRVSRLTAGGGKRTVADNYRGKRFNSPNDCVIHSSGAIYFTDPPYGLPKGWDDDRRELDFCGVYRVTPDGVVTLLCDTMTRPNGIAFSPDERFLYVADTGRSHVPNGPAHIRRFEISADGTKLGRSVVFAECTAGFFDGFRFDTEGNLWSSAGDGVHVYEPGGTLIGKILIPEIVANVTFGGVKRNRLFICATTSLYAAYTTATGAARG